MTTEITAEGTNNSRVYIILYLDMVLRGLISFFVVGIGLYFILIGYFKMTFVFLLPIAFIVSILISPFLMRIKLGEIVLTKYEGLLNKLLKKSFDGK
jgi:membrane protein implicated in regulation of membrane protease activity